MMNENMNWKESYDAAMEAIADCDFEEAERCLVHALNIAENAHGDAGILEQILYHLAFTYRQNNECGKAIQIYDRLLALQEPFHGKHSLEYAQTLQEIGDCYHETDDYHNAESYLRNVVEILERCDDVPVLLLAEALDTLAFNARMRESFEEAQLYAKRCIELYESFEGPDSLVLAQPYVNYSIILRELGQETEGIELEKRARRLREEFERRYPKVQ